jgi:hypothetical protein
MTKDSVLARKNELDQQRLQYIANLNAVVGAIQDCDYWIAKLDEEERQAAQGKAVEVLPPAIPIEATPVS